VTQAQCDLLGLWVTCTKRRRCRRHRICRSNQFDCYWSHREKVSPAMRAQDDVKCASLQAMLDIGPKFAG